MNTPKYGETYTCDFELRVIINGVQNDEIASALMADGRFCGILFERVVAHQVANYARFAPAKGFDLLRYDGHKIEVKTFTANGVDFSPSDMKGVGRKYDHDRFLSECASKDFIVVDSRNVAETHTLRWVMLPGDRVARIGRKITTKKDSVIFDNTQT